ncbi:IS1 family transposase, partial [Escherichia coli]|uniref:IS1 family transposase n=1 Tax=Escherichia coli TaxID=562 RepID=UPI003F890DCA
HLARLGRKSLSFSKPVELHDKVWICPYISRHLLSLNPLLACCRRYSRGER